ncbi:MAG: (2Fe-2S) ferredoxin domain-containing protein [Pygmaiobacter sp.]
MATKPVKIRSLADLAEIRERVLPDLDPGLKSSGARVVVGLATCGIAAGAQAVYDALDAELKKQELHDVLLAPTGCIGICQFEPVVEVYLAGQPKITYVRMTPEKAIRVVKQHLQGGNPICEFTIGARQ